jgi:Helix-turn-helix domain
MSIPATKWARALYLGDTKPVSATTLKALLLVIADYTNKQNQSWHKQETLAKDVGISTRTVRRALVLLREMGVIRTEPTKRADGGNANLMITLLMGASVSPSADTDVRAAADDIVRTPRTLVSAPYEPSVEPELETKEDNNRPTRFARETRGADLDDREPALPEECKEPGNGGSLRMYRQSQAEAGVAWRELERMGWGDTWEDEPMIHWYALLRKGFAAYDIVDAAADYLLWSHGEPPTLGDWLACFEHYAPGLAPTRRAPTIEHHTSVRHKGDDIALLQN